MDPPNREIVFRVLVVRDVRAKLCARFPSIWPFRRALVLLLLLLRPPAPGHRGHGVPEHRGQRIPGHCGYGVPGHRGQ